MRGSLKIFCPEMPILATSLNPFGNRECQELPSTWKVILEDGRTANGIITFPKVLVRWKGWGKWLVDEVPAKGPGIAVTMDPEHVVRTTWTTMNALPCLAYGWMMLFGKQWKIEPKTELDGSKTFFPNCVATAVGLGIRKYLAEPVTAEGEISDQ